MKKRLPAFLAGMLTTALVFGLTVSALAANGLISINAALNNIAIEVNSKPAIAKGENYTTDNGSETAGSILYNETTYVPLRKVAELLGAEIKWDASTGTANIVGQIEAPVAPTTPPGTTADYSDWTPEEETAYQEFKGIWDIELLSSGDVTYHMNGSYDNIPWEMYRLTYTGTLSRKDISSILVSEKAQKFLIRVANELRSSNVRVDMNICYADGGSFGFYSFR